MESSSERNFEYSDLDRPTSAIVRQRALEIKDLMRLTAENIINIGQKLTEVKETLGHGSFQSWLRTEFEWSEQTARQFMQVYRWSQTIENQNFVFSQLATSALYLLAAPSTPTEAREEVLSLVDGNEKISYTRVKNIVDRHRQQLSENAKVVGTVDVLVKNEAETKFTDEASNRFLTQSLMGETPQHIRADRRKTTGDATASRTALNRLFRLETPQLGCIVRLYHIAELEIITNLDIGSTVKIKVGRWQGHTARIVDVLQEQQLPMPDNEPVQSSSLSQLPQNQIRVHIIEDLDLLNRERLKVMSQNLIISYADTCLAIEGDSIVLTAFTEQIKVNPTFVESMFSQALELPAEST